MRSLRDRGVYGWVRSWIVVTQCFLAIGVSVHSIASTQTFNNDGADADLAMASPAQDGTVYLFQRTITKELKVYQHDPAGPPGPVYNYRGSLGGNLASGPSVVSWGPNHMAVFAVWDDNTVRMRTWNGGTSCCTYGWDSDWENLGTAFWGVTPGVVSMRPGHIAVIALGDSGTPYIREFNDGAWTASWVSLGGTTWNRPMPITLGTGHLAVVVKGGSDQVWYRERNGSTWGSWTNLGGAIQYYPVAVAHSAGIFVFGLGGSGGIYYRHRSSLTGSWSSWASITDQTFYTAPAVAKLPNNSIKLFARGGGYSLWVNDFYGGSGTWSIAAPIPVPNNAEEDHPVAIARDSSKWQVAISSGLIDGLPSGQQRVLVNTWQD